MFILNNNDLKKKTNKLFHKIDKLHTDYKYEIIEKLYLEFYSFRSKVWGDVSDKKSKTFSQNYKQYKEFLNKFKHLKDIKS